MTGKTCEIMQYIEYAPHLNKEFILNVIKEHSCIKEYCFILHDKDNEDGKPKPPHWHVFLQFKEVQHYENVAKWFNVDVQYVNKLKSRFKHACTYCTHANDKEKFQYDVNEVTCNFDYQERLETDKQIRENVDFDNYGILHYKRLYQYDARKLRDVDTLYKNYLEIKKNETGDRNMKVIYLSGASGCGKTTLAKALATKSYGWDEIFISSSSNDVLDGYYGQKCIILDDLRDSVMNFEDLLKFLDNNTNSSVKSRFSNKQLVRCELVIITSIKQPRELYTDVKEDKHQLYRRISEYMYISKQGEFVFMADYQYNDKIQQYEKDKMVNISAMVIDYINKHKKDINKSFCDSLLEQGLAVPLDTDLPF